MTKGDTKMAPKSWMCEAYECGSKTADLTYEDIVYGDLVPEWIWDNRIAVVFFEAGRRGCKMPRWVTGWRYGSIPESGFSRNYRDAKAESGVSLMAIDGEEPVKTLGQFYGLRGREVVMVGGWLVPYAVGSEGEPLVVGAVEIA